MQACHGLAVKSTRLKLWGSVECWFESHDTCVLKSTAPGHNRPIVILYPFSWSLKSIFDGLKNINEADALFYREFTLS